MISNTEIADILDEATRWAESHEAIIGLALVGSHANGKAREDSDIDLVLIASDPAEILVEEREWIHRFGTVVSEEKIEGWGLLTSVRVQYENSIEIEFGITSSRWIRIPSDLGTSRVISDGIVILYDPDERISRLVQHCHDEKINT